MMNRIRYEKKFRLNTEYLRKMKRIILWQSFKNCCFQSIIVTLKCKDRSQLVFSSHLNRSKITMKWSLVLWICWKLLCRSLETMYAWKHFRQSLENKNVKTTIVLDSLDNGITPNQLVDTFREKFVSYIIIH